MNTRYPQTFPPDEAASWRRIRKYAVPRAMIEQATRRRLAGDWRGACAAANVDVEFDLADLAGLHGSEAARRLEADLRDFAPDLARWHLPRYLRGRTTLRPGQRVILAGYGGQPAGAPYLHVTTLNMIDGPQRITLRFGDIDDEEDSWQYSRVQDWRVARHLWDARQAGRLLERCGGGDRAPFRNADGTARGTGELPAHDPGPADPAGHAEWVTMLRDRGDIEQALAAAGITLDATPPQVRYHSPPPLLEVLAEHPLALTRLEPEVRRHAASGLGDRFHIHTHRAIFTPIQLELNAGTPGLTVRLASWEDRHDMRLLPEASWHRLPDLDLLRFGDITPGELHPLVSASLFPARAGQPTDGPPSPDPQPPLPVRVRCRGEWHEVRSRDGRLRVPHSEEEERREQAMRAFGGPVTGCFAVAQAWTSGAGWLPKALREQRREFFSRVQHGDTAEVLRLLAAGVDPHIRDSRQRTLLHLLHLLDYQVMLPRLLDAGLDLEARDHHQRTPLHVAVGEGPVALVHALLAAGARTDAVDHRGYSLAFLVLQHRRKELRFLNNTVTNDYSSHPWRGTNGWGDPDD